jgi:hypothetical protein
LNDEINRLHEAMGMALRMYEQGARRSGRTTRMIDQVREGETVVCFNALHARHVQTALRERGLTNVRVSTCAPDMGEFVSTTAGVRGRIHLDHCWVHEWYSAAIIRATREIEGAVASRDAGDRPAPAAYLKMS